MLGLTLILCLDLGLVFIFRSGLGLVLGLDLVVRIRD